MLCSIGIQKKLVKNFYNILYMVLFLLIFFLVRNVNLKHILQLLFRALQELERCLVEDVWFAASCVVYRK